MANQDFIPIDARPVERLQRLNIFLQIYLPRANAIISTPPRILLWELPSMPASSSLLDHTIDAVSLSHLGAIHKDTRLVQASRKAYGLSLQLLIWACANPQQDKISHQEVLVSMLMIRFWVQTSSDPGKGDSRISLTHAFGAMSYIEAIKPSCLDLNSKFGSILLREFWGTDVWGGLAYRKRFIVSDTWDHRRPEHHFEMCRAISLLERTDKALSRPDALQTPQSQQDLKSLSQELTAAQTHLVKFCNGKSKETSTVVKAHDTDAFDPNIEEHCFMSESDLYPNFLLFNANYWANMIALHALACLMVHCALLRVSSNIQSPADCALSDSEKRAGLQMVTHICKNAYTISMLPSLASAEYLRVLLTASAAFAEESGEWRVMGWCQACLLATDMRIERLRRNQPPTLCRIGDLGDLLVESCRYQAWRPKP